MRDCTFPGQVTTVGIGQTAYYEYGRVHDPEFKLALQAILRAAEDAGIDPRHIERIRLLQQRSQRSVSPRGRARSLGATLLEYAVGRRDGGGSAAAGNGNAAAAVAAGLADYDSVSPPSLTREPRQVP